MQTRMWMVIAIVSLGGATSVRGEDLSATSLDDPRERILLCTPQGPVIVGLSLKIEGRPFRYAVEHVLDRQMALLGKDLSWKAALDNPLLLAGEFSNRRRAAERNRQITRHDLDGDGLVSRRELRQLILRRTGGELIRIVPTRRTSNVDDWLLSLVDANHDWRLSAEELERAAERLATADYSGDGAVSRGELKGASSQNPSPLLTLGMLLGRFPDASAAALLRTHYADREGKIARSTFDLIPELFDRLDANQDGNLQDAELARIEVMPAQIEIALDQQDADEKFTYYSLMHLAPQLLVKGDTAPSVSRNLEWHKGHGYLGIYELTTRQPGAPSKKVQQCLNLYDRDKNGILRAADLDIRESREFGMVHFACWDLDGDQQVTEAELQTAFTRELAITRCWFEISLNRGLPNLFARLDTNVDGLIGARESRNLTKLLRRYDADGDGELSYHEIPYGIGVNISRGEGTSSFTPEGDRSELIREVLKSGPKWFRQMDGNEDGDVSLKEFLGTPEQFKRLDADHDGLIDPDEASAGTPP